MRLKRLSTRSHRRPLLAAISALVLALPLLAAPPSPAQALEEGAGAPTACEWVGEYTHVETVTGINGVYETYDFENESRWVSSGVGCGATYQMSVEGFGTGTHTESCADGATSDTFTATISEAGTASKADSWLSFAVLPGGPGEWVAGFTDFDFVSAPYAITESMTAFCTLEPWTRTTTGDGNIGRASIPNCRGADPMDEPHLVGPNAQAFVAVCVADRPVMDEGLTSEITVSVRARRVDCDTSVDTDGDGVGDCAEYDAWTDPNDSIGTDPWDELVQLALEEYYAATADPSVGIETLGFYYQILNITCASARSTRDECAHMAPYYDHSGWSDDWVFDVFDGYLRTDYIEPDSWRGEILENAGPVFGVLADACASQSTPYFLGPFGALMALARAACEPLAGDLGALGPGAPHFATQLDPWFKRVAMERLTTSADPVEAACSIRRQHEALFMYAVAPGFDEVHAAGYMSSVGVAAAQSVVPAGAALFRDRNLIEVLDGLYGEDEANRIYQTYVATCGTNAAIDELPNIEVGIGGAFHIATLPVRFAAASLADFIYTSDPVFAGQVTVAEDGSVTADLVLPEAVAAGEHILHIQGVSPEGQAVEIVQPITVLADPTHPFTDIDASFAYDEIIWVFKAGITKGCTETLYCPKASVTRGQMAAFLVRALNLPATDQDFFTDDETSTFETSINRLAAAGITGGCTATTFCPKAVVTREQMAAFLFRGLTR